MDVHALAALRDGPDRFRYQVLGMDTLDFLFEATLGKAGCEIKRFEELFGMLLSLSATTILEVSFIFGQNNFVMMGVPFGHNRFLIGPRLFRQRNFSAAIVLKGGSKSDMKILRKLHFLMRSHCL